MPWIDNRGVEAAADPCGGGKYVQREDDPDMWTHAAEAAIYMPLDRYIVFELRVNEARCHGYGDVPMPSTRKWSADQ